MLIHTPRWTRRQFLQALGQGALLSTLPGQVLADTADVVSISVLHTTDLHGHILPTTDYLGRPDLGGLARCATQIRTWRAANPHSILLDIGDVYQGTAVSLINRGTLMISCLNALRYDAWVVGNHEFDWGVEAFTTNVKNSVMPVLSGNALWAGHPLRDSPDLAKIQPYFVKEVAGFRIAIIGLTTPALTSWLPPENLRGFETIDPVEALGTILAEVNELHVDAVILAGHMGLIRRDNEANPVGALTRAFPQLTVCLGGHSHQNHSGDWVNGVLYSQADHYGIYAGKVDLTFDRQTRKLLARTATTVLMDEQIALDPLVLSLSRNDLEVADRMLAQEVGTLAEPLSAFSASGGPSEQERLIASGIVAALHLQGVAVDAVVHGLFEARATLAAGPKTVADLWSILPYENQIVTVDLPYSDLLTLAQEITAARDARPLMGVQLVSTRAGAETKIAEIRAADGSPLQRKPFYRVALNSYDSQSGGGRFPLLGKLVADPAHGRRLYPVQIRDALIDFFLQRKIVSRASLLV